MVVYRAGMDTDAYCGKCKMILAHVIHAVGATGKPARVECKTCGAIHGYRAAAPGSGKTTTTKRASTARKSPETIFEELIAGRDISQPTRYTIREEFEAETVVDHKKFGLGVVTKIMADQKIEVTFREGVKVLIHGR